MLFQVLFACVLLTAPTWGQEYAQYGSQGGQGDYHRPTHGGVADNAPQDYNFGYDVKDDFGNTHFHQEQADAYGSVRGTYGYKDVQGIYRFVNYEADEDGYRANIKSNEPGMSSLTPADVTVDIEEPPQGVAIRPPTDGRPLQSGASQGARRQFPVGGPRAERPVRRGTPTDAFTASHEEIPREQVFPRF